MKSGTNTCIDVEDDYYSPNNSTNQYKCNNKPAHSYYHGEKSEFNSAECPWECNTSYIKSWTTCVQPSCWIGKYRLWNNCVDCTIKPPNSNFTSEWSWGNNCQWTCNTWYNKSWNRCELNCTSTQREINWKCEEIWDSNWRTFSWDENCFSASEFKTQYWKPYGSSSARNLCNGSSSAKNIWIYKNISTRNICNADWEKYDWTKWISMWKDPWCYEEKANWYGTKPIIPKKWDWYYKNYTIKKCGWEWKRCRYYDGVLN